jgi:hypothetical protein
VMEISWWMVGLGVVWGLLAFPIFIAGVLGIPGNPGPNDKMALATGLLMVGALLPVAACIGGILFGLGWLAPHGLWRGETFLLAPFALPPLAVFLLADSAWVRLCVIGLSALLIWLSQYLAFYILFLLMLLAIVILGVVAAVYEALNP